MPNPAPHVAALLWLVAAGSSFAAAVDFPRFPSINNDGSQIVFSWRGDLWKAPVTGGSAIRLTSHPADEGSSIFSPDGSLIAFESTRDGFQNLYVMNADGSALRQVSDIDRSLSLSDFAVDRGGQAALLFDAALQPESYRASRPYEIPLAGGEISRVHDAFGSMPVADDSGHRIAFVRGASAWSRRSYRGPDNRNIWLFDRDANSFRQLTTWAGNDSHPRWGGPRTIFYLSDREFDRFNLYRMSADEGDSVAARLTAFDDRDIQDYDVSSDGRVAVIMAWDSLYTLDLTNPAAKPVQLTITAADDELDNIQLRAIGRDVSEAQLSPDGKVMAVVAYGEILVRAVDDRSPTRRVTNTHAREHGVVWSADGKKLYFVSDADGTESILTAEVTATRDDIRKAYDEAVKPPAATSPAAEPSSTLPQTQPAEPEAAAPATQPATTEPASTEPASATQADASRPARAGGKRPEKPKDENRWVNALTFAITPLVAEPTNDRDPSPSPDGKFLAFRRGPGALMLLDLATNQSRELVSGWDPELAWRWSGDSRFIAYQQTDHNANSDIWIIRSDGSTPPVNVTRHPDNDIAPRWSADGRVLAFLSERTNEEFDVWAVYLDKALETLTRVELDEYYKEAAKLARERKPLNAKKDDKKKDDEPKEGAADESKDDKKDEKKEDKSDDDSAVAVVSPGKPPETLDLDDAYLRLRRLSSFPGDEADIELTGGGDRVIFAANDGERSLLSVKWDGADKKRLGAPASVQHLTLSSDRAVTVSGGQASTVKVEGGEQKTYDVEETMRVDLQQQAAQKFLEAARVLGEVFYHPTMKGLDWPRLTAAYLELAKKTRTADEFNTVAARFIGELNASHLGVSSPGRQSPISQPCGRLGTLHEKTADGIRILQVIPETPAARGSMALKPGDLIIAIDGEPFAPADTLESRLRGRVGKETLFTVQRVHDGREIEFRTLIAPISFEQFSALSYNHWQRTQLAKVTEWSNGAIGYAHIAGMDQGSLDEFERDLFAAADGKRGLIIDVRNNGGGWTADRLLASIMVQKHAYTVPRGQDPSIHDGYPQDRLFIQRYTLPINMLCNEKSFSNAEITAHAFKTLKRGTLVGQQTYGGVISTGGTRLIDGTTVRLPGRGWYLPDGTDMENNGAIPDLLVPQTPQDESASMDAQLKAAVDDLLKRLP
jgi:tricorn protease